MLMRRWLAVILVLVVVALGGLATCEEPQPTVPDAEPSSAAPRDPLAGPGGMWFSRTAPKDPTP